MLFTVIMKLIRPFFKPVIVLILVSMVLQSCTKTQEPAANQVVKIALRDVGHQLLLSNQDSTTVVPPIQDLGDNHYQLQFNTRLSIHPDSLVQQVKTSFKKANLPNNYITEVQRCSDNQVAYSYQIKQDTEQGIVPCGGRALKQDCYTINVAFYTIKTTTSFAHYTIPLALLIIGLLWFIKLRSKPKVIRQPISTNAKTIGSYTFYPEQNKLIKHAKEITLSKKECELLSIFIAQPNQIIKRETLSKRVWEDHGVVVGRSLDTYISKLRKKLQEDQSIKLTNVHGVGYKLEVE